MTTINEGGATFKVPSDIEHFLWYFKHSKFLPCFRNNSKKFFDVNPGEKYARPLITQDKFKAAVNARDWMYKRKVPVFLNGGAFLGNQSKLSNLHINVIITVGWYRQCGIISFTPDWDFVFPQKSYSAKLLEDISCEETWSIVHVYGKVYLTLVLPLFLHYQTKYQNYFIKKFHRSKIHWKWN